MITKDIMQCTSDMLDIAECGKYTLAAQTRAFDLLEKITDLPEGGLVGPADVYSDTVATWCSSLGPAEEFCREYKRLEEMLEKSYDQDQLMTDAEEALKDFVAAEKVAGAKAVFAEKVHECAKETFEIWQNGGYFARQKALRKLRSLAGFRLESSRIGNYVAKTFDLMNEARMAHARSQQAVFAANASYKVKPGVYADIYRCMNQIKR